MPRANRCFLPGYVWHITHRCHKKEFLLRFAKDRKRWCRWLFEAKKRYGLCILNYVATSNHIHLLVRDTGNQVIARSMQLIAGRTAQEFNQRKGRKGAFWEDRYHATAMAADDHLIRCMTYIDLNMVRAGVVNHPSDWGEGGYAELFSTRQRYGLIDRCTLMKLLNIESVEQLQTERRRWVDSALSAGASARDERWSGSIAVGHRVFVDRVKAALEIEGQASRILEDETTCFLREDVAAYHTLFEAKKRSLRVDSA
jgi:putative transposase